jgi:uncharacterized protein with beta-barrel porin domain
MSSARAVCTPPAGAGTPPPGTTVTCTGTTYNQNSVMIFGTVLHSGYGDGTQNGVTVNVPAGASVTGDLFGFYLGDNNTVVNSGQISGWYYAGVYPGAGIRAKKNLTVINSGTIGADPFYSYSILATDLTLTNSGSILGLILATDAVITNSGSLGPIHQATNLQLTNSGTITGISDLGFGFYTIIATTASITNSGTIKTESGGGINVGNLTLNNSGLISGGRIVIDASGRITGSRGTGILATTMDVTNSGSISGFTGIHSTGGNSKILNAGTISGFGGPAILFEGGGNILTLTADSIINGDVVAGATDTLRLGGTGRGTFDVSSIGNAAQYRGFGLFNKVDEAVWSLTGANTQALPWTVQQGVLLVDGSLPSSSFTVTGGVLGGTGTLGNTTINGGALSPGNSIGVINVAGNLTFGSLATYLVEVSSTDADRTNVTGIATLAGTVLAYFQPGNSLARNYTILSAAGGRSGTFDALETFGLPNFFHASLDYTATDVLLDLTMNMAAVSGLNRNQRSVADAIDRAFNAGGLPAAFSDLLLLSSASVPVAMTELSGELGTAAAQTAFDSMDRFLVTMLDPQARAGAVDPMAGAYAANLPAKAVNNAPPPTPFAQRWTAWGAAYGGAAKYRGDDFVGSHDVNIRIAGMAAGGDYRVRPDTVLGFALGGASANYNVLGSGRDEIFQAGAYGAWQPGAAYLTGGVAYAAHDLSTDRTVLMPRLIDRLSADFVGHGAGARAEAGYRVASPQILGTVFGVTPFAAAQMQTFHTPNYGERDATGLAAFALDYGRHTTRESRSELGAQVDATVARFLTAAIDLRARAAWGHEFTTDRFIDATFQALGTGFSVFGASPARDAALASAAAEVKFKNGLTARAKFDGRLAGGTQVYAGTGSLSKTW